MKKNGETLIESLLSMFFIVVVIVPVSNIFLKSYKLDTKINNSNKIKELKYNMIELIKTKKDDEIMGLIGNYEIKNIKEFYDLFFIENKYRILKNDLNEIIEISIKKIKNPINDEINNMEIKIDNIKEYYEKRGA